MLERNVFNHRLIFGLMILKEVEMLSMNFKKNNHEKGKMVIPGRQQSGEESWLK